MKMIYPFNRCLESFDKRSEYSDESCRKTLNGLWIGCVKTFKENNER